MLNKPNVRFVRFPFSWRIWKAVLATFLIHQQNSHDVFAANPARLKLRTFDTDAQQLK